MVTLSPSANSLFYLRMGTNYLRQGDCRQLQISDAECMLLDRRRVIVLAISTLLGCVLSIFTGVLLWLRFGRVNVSRNFATQSEKQPFQYHGLSETEAATRLVPFDEDAFQQKERRRFFKAGYSAKSIDDF